VANYNINIGANSAYNYAYTKPIEAEQQQKKLGTSIGGATVNTQNMTIATAAPAEQLETHKNIEKAHKTQKNSEVKSLYEAQQEEIKRQEEGRKRRAEEERRAEYLKELSDKLNKRMNSFSKHIKFGINDRADSIVVSIVEQNNEKKLKELSAEDADKLFRRLDYVLGVLFDNKA
jgi:uncharacterized FlaG/YvyC family protein